jgi:phosphatidylglycerol:prolipoprotein diacylglycerol transferase
LFDAFGIHLGPLYIHYYALILGLGIFAATWVTARRAKDYGYTSDDVWDALTWVFIPGLLGARLYHVLTPTPASGITTEYYLQHPVEIFAIWNGGLGIYGAIIGGALGLWVYTRRRHYSLLRMLDLAAPAILLAQAIGRWGNFVNQELYGAPSSLPWAIYISPEHRLPGYEQYSTFHPLFLYESIWNLLAFVLLLNIARRFRPLLRDGDLMLIYMILYGVVRFLLDFVRLDSNGGGALTTAQWLSLALCVLSAVVLVVRHRRPRVQPQTGGETT